MRHKPRVVGATPYMPESFDVKLIGLAVLGAAFVAGVEYYAIVRQRREEAASGSAASTDEAPESA